MAVSSNGGEVGSGAGSAMFGGRRGLLGGGLGTWVLGALGVVSCARMSAGEQAHFVDSAGRPVNSDAGSVLTTARQRAAGWTEAALPTMEGVVALNRAGRVQTTQERLGLLPYLPGKANTTLFDLLTNMTEQSASLQWVLDTKEAGAGQAAYDAFMAEYAAGVVPQREMKDVEKIADIWWGGLQRFQVSLGALLSGSEDADSESMARHRAEAAKLVDESGMAYGFGLVARLKEGGGRLKEKPLKPLPVLRDTSLVVPLGLQNMLMTLNMLTTLAADDSVPEELVFISNADDNPQNKAEHVWKIQLLRHFLITHFAPRVFPADSTRIRWGFFKGSGGAMAGRWLGLSRMTTSFVAAQDNDDGLIPGRMRRRIELLRNRLDIDILLHQNWSWNPREEVARPTDSVKGKAEEEEDQGGKKGQAAKKDGEEEDDATSSSTTETEAATALTTAMAPGVTDMTQYMDEFARIVFGAMITEPAFKTKDDQMNLDMKDIQAEYKQSWKPGFRHAFLMGSIAGWPQIPYVEDMNATIEAAAELRKERGIVLVPAENPRDVPLSWNSAADPILVAREKEDLQFAVWQTEEGSVNYEPQYFLQCTNGWNTGRREALSIIPPTAMGYGEDALNNYIALASGLNLYCLQEVGGIYVSHMDHNEQERVLSPRFPTKTPPTSTHAKK